MSEVYDREEDFSDALSKNLNQLDLGIFTNARCEVATANRIADIVAVGNDSDEKLVIENQFGIADWDHWGRLEGYARHHDATIGVLIAEGFEDLMIRACKERNIESLISWYLIQVQVTTRTEFSFFNIVEPTPTDLDAATKQLRRRTDQAKNRKTGSNAISAFWQPIRDDISCLFHGKPLAATNHVGITKKVTGKPITVNLLIRKDHCKIKLVFKGNGKKTQRDKAKVLFADYHIPFNKHDTRTESGFIFRVLDKGNQDISDWIEIRKALVQAGTYIYETVSAAF